MAIPGIASYVHFTSISDSSGAQQDGIGVLIVLPLSVAVGPNEAPRFALSRNSRSVPSGRLTVWDLRAAIVRAYWYVFVATEDMTGTYQLRMDWRDADRTSYSETISFAAGTVLNRETVLTVRPQVPHLRDLLGSPLSATESARMGQAGSIYGDAPDPGTTRDREARAVVDVLRHVHGRLRAGLGELWAATSVSSTKDGKALCDWDPATLTTEQERLEAWAQAISEHGCPSTYNGAGASLGMWLYPTRGGDATHDADAGFLMSIRRHLGTTSSSEVARTKSRRRPDGTELVTSYSPPADGSLGNSNATGELCLPLCFACQQLAAWVLFTAGHDELAENPVAATFPYKPLIDERREHAFAGAVVTAAELRNIVGENFLKPGTLLFRHYTTGSPHVGVVIRTPGQEGFQLLDTGGWNAGGAEGSGNHDTFAMTRTTAAASGVMMPGQLFKADIATVIRRLRAARPLGVAQLAIYRRSSAGMANNELLWASGLVPLHEVLDSTPLPGTASVGVTSVPAPPNQVGYPIARLMAALRGCPHADELSVHWFVRTPFSPSGTSGRDAEKTNAVAFVIRHGRGPTGGWGPTALNWWDAQSAPLPPGDERHPPLPELGPHGPWPIQLKTVAHIEVERNGVPRISAIDSQNRPLERAHQGTNLLTVFRRNSPAVPVAVAHAGAPLVQFNRTYTRFVDLGSRPDLTAQIPQYFGGGLTTTPIALAPSTTSPTAWNGQDSWGVVNNSPAV